MIKNVLFDMDGTLVDSEGAIAIASREALKLWGIDCELKEFAQFVGMGDTKFIGGVAEAHGVPYVPEMKQAAYDYYIENMQNIGLFPWSREIITYFSQKGLKVAVASASEDRRVMCNVSRLGLGKDSFTAVITGTSVKNAKPDPEVFLKACEAIGAVPSECLVFEDSRSGVKAAKAAGMKCIAVTTGFSEDELYAAGADLVTNDLRNVCRLLDIFEI